MTELEKHEYGPISLPLTTPWAKKLIELKGDALGIGWVISAAGKAGRCQKWFVRDGNVTDQEYQNELLSKIRQSESYFVSLVINVALSFGNRLKAYG